MTMEPQDVIEENSDRKLKEIKEQIESKQLNVYDMKWQIPWLVQLTSKGEDDRQQIIESMYEENQQLKEKIEKEAKFSTDLVLDYTQLQSKLEKYEKVVGIAKAGLDFAHICFNAEPNFSIRKTTFINTYKRQFDKSLAELEGGEGGLDGNNI